MPKLTSIKGVKERLLILLKKKAYKKKEVILSSGRKSNFYVDARRITLSSEGAFLVASIILEMIKADAVQAIGGPTIGADPIAGAIGVLSYLNGRPLKTFIVRKNPKAHGTKRQIEGPALRRGYRVIVVDDVATTGGSMIETISALKKQGLKVNKAICIVDRQEGATENLSKVGCKLVSIFKKKDFQKTR
ncbi:MAG: orotate phosphoribosyltransferase [Candidatus Omnitrophota bacterium]